MGKKLSLVLPTYNGSSLLRQHLPNLIMYLNDLSIDYEILIVDDGSKDQQESKLIAQENGCRFFSIPHNQGKGAALRMGMLEAGGDFIIFTDADIPYEFEVIKKFLWQLEYEKSHIVVGDRTLHESKYFANIPWVRSVGSKIYSFIVGHFMVSGLFDTQCGIKGFQAEVAKDLFYVSRINRFAIDVEILYIALKRNYVIKRLPVNLRVWEPTQIRPFYDGLTMLIDLFVIWQNFRLGNYRAQNIISKSTDPINDENKAISPSGDFKNNQISKELIEE
jgi:dolichyl-phosphate beta-glucosyltransferase